MRINEDEKSFFINTHSYLQQKLAKMSLQQF